MADLDALNVVLDHMTADGRIVERDELCLLQAALNRLPLRSREVITLREIQGLPQYEVALRMGASVAAVEPQMVHGVGALDFMLGGPRKIRRGDAGVRQVLAGE